jgi:hypothetical protein
MPKIFVGSSTEQKDVATEICDWIEETKCEVLHWQDATSPGDEYYSRLLHLAQSMDGAVFIFGPDDKTWYRTSFMSTPRDNVVFEYGLFTGRHGIVDPKRAIICRLSPAKMATDLDGLVYVNYGENKSRAKRKIQEWVKKVVIHCSNAVNPLGISRHSKTKKELFEEGTRLIENAARSIFLCAKTPIPLMGPRPYSNSVEKYDYEEHQYKIYWEIAERAAQSKIMFSIAASIPCVKKEISKISDRSFRERFKENLKKLSELTKKSSYVQLLWYSGEGPSTFLVADSDSLLWFKGGNGDNVWIRDSSNDLATALRSSSSDLFSKLSLKALHKELRV